MVEFDPRTFYDFANYIKGMTNSIPEEIVQAAYRTCISRAYYAAFLSTRDKILLLPIREDVRRTIERSELTHAVLAEIIKKIDSELGDCFANLRKRRNNADYNTKIEIKPKDVVWALKSADRIIKELPARLEEIGESDIIMAWGKSAEEAEIKRIAEKLKDVGLEKLTSSPP